MRKSFLTGLTVLGLVFCSAMSAMAYDYTTIGSNITIFDQIGDDTTGWYGNQEDNEVEFSNQYHATATQAWDMEAFFWKNETQTLTMIGGYDLINGEDNIDPGHVFLDAGSDGTWDYAISFNNTGSATWYNVSGLSVGSGLSSTTYFPTSNPWQYVSGATGSGTLDSDYTASITNDLVGVATGGSHNAIALDLSDLTLGTSFAAHFTMECGNDNLMGITDRETPNVPIPGAVWLLSSGLAGLIGVHRRRR